MTLRTTYRLILGLSALGALGLAHCSGEDTVSIVPPADGGSVDTSTLPDTSGGCTGAMASCGGVCTDTANDPKNCGGCGKVCPASDAGAGQCVASKCTSCDLVDDDKDGFNACVDCDDKDPNVNPGAFDVPGNGVDDNCDGTKDEVKTCDTALASDSVDALDFAKAIDICEVPVAQSFPVVADAKAHQIAPDWGTVFKPQLGVSFAALSSGIAADTNGTKPPFNVAETPAPGTDYAKTGTAFPGTPSSYKCTTRLSAPATVTEPAKINDYTELKIQLKVPTNAHSFAIDANFLGSDYPHFLCDNVDDEAFILLDSKAYQGSLGRDTRGTPLSVNSNFLALTQLSALAGTGFDKTSTFGDPTKGGATGWLTVEGPVVPGETITLRFIIADFTDGIYDSQLLIDHFRWQTKTLCGPQTTGLVRPSADAGADAAPIEGGTGPVCSDGGIVDSGGGG